MENKINKLIKGAYQDLHDYHQNTFDYDECEWLKNKDELTGQEIYDYTYDMEMTRQEDACYIAGKIEAYEGIKRELPTRIGLTYEEIEKLKNNEIVTIEGIEIFNSEEKQYFN